MPVLTAQTKGTSDYSICTLLVTEQLERMKYCFNFDFPRSYEVIYTYFRYPHLSNQVIKKSFVSYAVAGFVHFPIFHSLSLYFIIKLLLLLHCFYFQENSMTWEAGGYI